jgi:uncharacterized lipoprotein YddW (UPF0748 family)
VAVGFYPETFNDFQPGTNLRQQMGRMQVDWRRWAEEGLIDIIRLSVDGGAHGLDDWRASSSKTYAEAQRRGVKLYVDVSIDGAFQKLSNFDGPLPLSFAEHPEQYVRVIRDVTRGILASSADGAFFYEAQDTPAQIYEAIRQGAGR